MGNWIIKALPKPFLEEKPLQNKLQQNKNQSVEERIQDIWSRTLNIQNFDPDQSFFNLGGNSLAAMVVRNELEEVFGVKINIVDLFQYSNLKLISERITELLKASGNTMIESEKLESKIDTNFNEPIAIVGMSCRIPGATNRQSFWDLLMNAESNVVDFNDENLKKHQVGDALVNDRAYVKRGAVFEDCFNFDASFFGYSVKDAELMDPHMFLIFRVCLGSLRR